MESLLDTDLYKLTQQQIVRNYFPNVNVTYKFIDRKTTWIENPVSFLGMFNDELDKICSLSLRKHECRYLQSLGFFRPDYLDYLENFKFNKNDIESDITDGVFNLTIRGKWMDTILWEIPLLAATTKAYLQNTPPDLNRHYKNLREKRNLMNSLRFAEFGTRRRRNFDYQHLAVRILKSSNGFIGTSNVYIAQLENVKPVGTMAHEWIMGNAGLFGVRKANKMATYNWTEFYQDCLDVVLTDTYTTDVFLRDFDKKLAETLKGVRQDSGSPITFAHKIYDHYIKLGINTSHKTIYFSDSLDPLKCQNIDKTLDIDIQRIYCIGSNFTNDQKLNLVIKLSNVNSVDVVKLSDEIGKETGSIQTISDVKKELNL